ncbi:hypothetical protein [Paenibacillus sp. PL2-23]|uniref:hypothetical protein n=1 Tax=Paenibacillus sp. PL2-23 TaxID=2100729 RepID=UPI0030F773AE
MFELELQEWLPYLLSIGWICAVAGLYTVNLHADGLFDRMKMPEDDLPLPSASHGLEIMGSRRQWLVRYVKRKDAPEEEEADCPASLDLSETNQRGGCLCQREYFIHPAGTGPVYCRLYCVLSFYWLFRAAARLRARLPRIRLAYSIIM